MLACETACLNDCTTTFDGGKLRMYGFVIAILLCNGTNCDLIQAEPDVSYPSFELCTTALSTKAAAVQAIADKQASADRPARIICLHPIDTIVEVEEPHDVLDTAMVHKDPAAASLFVGLVEKGTRTLVTGLVAGTGRNWCRCIARLRSRIRTS